jgi:hypothetical protein
MFWSETRMSEIRENPRYRTNVPTRKISSVCFGLASTGNEAGCTFGDGLGDLGEGLGDILGDILGDVLGDLVAGMGSTGGTFNSWDLESVPAGVGIGVFSSFSGGIMIDEYRS